MSAARRYAFAVLAVLAVALSSACSVTTTTDRPTVLTTFTVLADIARNVAGEHADVNSLTKFGAEIHGYEPTPGDLHKAVDASLVVVNGLHLDDWFERFLDDIHVPRIVASDGIAPIPISSTPGDVTTSGAKPNPHAWMSPVAVKTYADNIAAGLARIDPGHADDYRSNAADYGARLDAEQRRLASAVAALPANERALVSCEGAFSYLARDTGLTEHYIWPVNSEQEATPQQMRRTVDFVRDRQVPAVFCESTVNDAPMRQVQNSTGARFGGILYVDSLSEPDGPVPTYLDLLRHDINTIVDGLTGKDAAHVEP
ncbi:metal ABC transporter substrate-binding protein [Gordonia insulae]|uniref:Metal ABC transporter substrate-binding protein Hpf n=1 Tax=Gordonia insulae TaxID=2420509 RepID=A0A3G8JN01_9ACTN|nr:metal ABC transporter substrate-binding protein [Gordonia insulae]AZG46447.1 Putative metal ABC transporter substrate-binding protein Hpf [Gordonia insulae]